MRTSVNQARAVRPRRRRSWRERCSRLSPRSQAATVRASGSANGTYNLQDAEPIAGVGGAAGNSTLAHETWWQDSERVPTQTAQALALGLGLVPDDRQEQVQQILLREIQAHNGHIATGLVGTPYLMRVLADLAPEIGQGMADKRDGPSWYAMSVGSGSDLMRETWNGGAVVMPPLGSNLPFWNYHALAGIRPDSQTPSLAPGFKGIVIKPAIVGDLHYVQAETLTASGPVAVTWRRRGNTLALDVALPANTTATIWVPTTDPASVRHDDASPDATTAVSHRRDEPGHAVYTVNGGGGIIRFSATINPLLAN